MLPKPLLDVLYRRFVAPQEVYVPPPPEPEPEPQPLPDPGVPAAAPPPPDPGADADARALRRSKVTVLTDIPFWESAYGSHSRLQSILSAIASECDLTVFVFKSVGPAVKQQLARIDARYHVVSYKSYEEKATEPLKPGRVGRDPALSDRIVDSWVRSTKRFLARHPQDAVIVEYIDRSYLLDAVPPGTARLLDAHDVMSSRIGVFARFGKVPSIRMSAADEARIMAHYDAIIAISRFDAADISHRLGLRRVLTVPHQAALRMPPGGAPADLHRRQFGAERGRAALVPRPGLAGDLGPFRAVRRRHRVQFRAPGAAQRHPHGPGRRPGRRAGGA